MKTLPFKMFSSYKTKSGNYIRIVDKKNIKGYECVMGNDNIWRYNREEDRGRVTGSNFDMSDPKNLIPETAF